MIILDTNIISEIMKSEPSDHVVNWLNQQEAVELFITAITIAEISYGLNVLSKGKRRTTLEEAFNNAILNAFRYRILSFDEPSAQMYGKIMRLKKKSGYSVSVPDGQIASIARVNGAMIATRNIRGFTDCGLELINPFGKSPVTH